MSDESIPNGFWCTDNKPSLIFGANGACWQIYEDGGSRLLMEI